jgi:hypothetical protein
MVVRSCSEREAGCGKMSSNGWLERGNRDLYRQGRPGAGCTSTETIGQGERYSGAALCAECSGLVGGISGSWVWLQREQFQCGSEPNGVRRGGLGRLGCKAGVAQRAIDAMHVHVRHEARVSVCVRERGWHSRRPHACAE